MAFSSFEDHSPAMGKRPTGDPSTLDAPRRALWDAAEAAQEDLANLSKRIGRNHAYLRQYLWRRSPAKLDEEDRDKLAARLGVTAEYLKTGLKPKGDAKPVDNPQRLVEPETIGAVQFARETRGLGQYPKTLKILGHVRAGVDGFFLDQGEIQGMAPRVPALEGVKGAFAAYVRDDSMFPAYETGDVIFVNPNLPVNPPCNVVIEMTDGQAFVKRLVRRTEKAVICMQWEPREEVKYDPKKVKNIYRILRPTEWGVL